MSENLPVCTELFDTPWVFGNYEVTIDQNIGNRKTQEDRFCICNKLINGHDDVCFFGVFDGTVGEFASNNIKDIIIPAMLSTPIWKLIVEHIEKGDLKLTEEFKNILRDLMVTTFKKADSILIEKCKAEEKHYSSCTGVVLLFIKDILVNAHIGDSRSVACTYSNSINLAQFLTIDHKPDQPLEYRRIVENGGSVEYLQNHNNKPFLRGGDFTRRRARGETPMQLQYSRAFGGKDLKPYGLSCVPDISIIGLNQNNRLFIIATDGIWDLLSAQQSCDLSFYSQELGIQPARYLVNAVLEETRNRNTNCDNLTAICIMYIKS
ncbi:Protein phosphatase 2C family protein [Cryptosporidium hominis]|nr:Protein phosphatase 2C [Cryptosporidium hominis]PPA62949.1 Protein phosphatase 2C family protein [Cryptosporidium hominis]